VFQASIAEVHEYPNFVPGGLQVVNYLSLFCAAHSDKRLELNEDTIEANKICAIFSFDRSTLVCERKLYGRSYSVLSED
jgi:hypothetical protein